MAVQNTSDNQLLLYSIISTSVTFCRQTKADGNQMNNPLHIL